MILRPYSEFKEACLKAAKSFKDFKTAYEQLGRNKLTKPQGRFHK